MGGVGDEGALVGGCGRHGRLGGMSVTRFSDNGVFDVFADPAEEVVNKDQGGDARVVDQDTGECVGEAAVDRYRGKPLANRPALALEHMKKLINSLYWWSRQRKMDMDKIGQLILRVRMISVVTSALTGKEETAYVDTVMKRLDKLESLLPGLLKQRAAVEVKTVKVAALEVPVPLGGVEAEVLDEDEQAAHDHLQQLKGKLNGS